MGRICPLNVQMCSESGSKIRAGPPCTQFSSWIPTPPCSLQGSLSGMLHPASPSSATHELETTPRVMSSRKEELGNSRTTSFQTLLFNPSSNSTAAEKNRTKGSYPQGGVRSTRGCPTPASLNQHPSDGEQLAASPPPITCCVSQPARSQENPCAAKGDVILSLLLKSSSSLIGAAVIHSPF